MEKEENMKTGVFVSSLFCARINKLITKILQKTLSEQILKITCQKRKKLLH